MNLIEYTTTINNLDVYTLSTVFQYLNLQDLVACSKVCQKWNEAFNMTKPRHLFICYGTKFIPKKNTSPYPTLIPNYTSFLAPIDSRCNSVLQSFNIKYFQFIQNFIFHGNDHFVIPNSFSLKFFPKLKHLEVMDQQFCENIKENYKTDKYHSSTIETLIIKNAILNLIPFLFPNLKHLEIHEVYINSIIINNNLLKTAQWKSFSLKDGFIDNSVLGFLAINCPTLEIIDVNINNNSHLEKLLIHPNLKRIFVKFLNLSYCTPSQNLGPVILKYEKNLKNNCFLYINNQLIRCFSDYSTPQIILDNNNFQRIPELIKRKKSFFKNFELKNVLEIRCNFDIDLYLNNNQNSEYLEEVKIKQSINEIKINENSEKLFFEKIDLIELFKALPRSIKFLYLNLDYTVSQHTLNLIPQYFPYLQTLSLNDLGNKEYNFSFMINLKYISCLNLHYVYTENSQELIDAIKNCNFLCNLVIVTKPKIGDEFGENLMNAFYEKQKINPSSKYHFVLNNNFEYKTSYIH